MERYSSNSKRAATPQVAQQAAGAAQETFSEMANVTAAKSGIVGKLLVLSLIIVSIAVTAFVGFAVLRALGDSASSNVQKDNYQAVFLTDGQIYFGKFDDSSNNNYATLEDIYYLQVEQQVQPVQGSETTDQQARISLAKLGNELHGPDDKMFINRDQILFWENLKDEGQVSTAIQQDKDGTGTENSSNTNSDDDASTEDDSAEDEADESN